MVLVLCYVGLTASVYMTGVVWFAQLVHYPLLSRGGSDDFTAFANEYQRRTLWVVVPGLVSEVSSTLGLVVLYPCLPTWIGLALLAGIWAMTCRYQIPQHLRLKRGYCEKTHHDLVRLNFPRSILWTARAIVMVWTMITLPATPIH